MGERPLPPNAPEQSNLSSPEIRAALDALSDIDFDRLDRIAVALTRHTGADPGDLLQEAFVRALAGTRCCPRHVGVIKFLAETMRSIRSDWAKGAERRAEVSLTETTDADKERNVLIADPRPLPDAEIVASQFSAAVLALFTDDPAAQKMIAATIEGLEGEELRFLVGLDRTAFDSKRRLIRRRIDKAFPKEFTR